MFERGVVRDSGLLRVGGGHSVYWEEAGEAHGIPAVHLHGGPGAGLGQGGYRKWLDPARFRIIGLDQRGCGRSLPHVTAPGYDLSENTTGHLIEDLERLREHLGVQRWLLNGVSCGCTLALAYAQRHPERVLGVVLMAVRTDGRFEIDWITETVGAIYPEAWDQLAAHAEHAGIGYRRGSGRLIEAYARLMTDADPTVRDATSVAWAEWEQQHISIGASREHDPRCSDAERRQALAILVTHFWAHDSFLASPILEHMSRLDGIPATLLHGRRDVSSPLAVAWKVHRAWPTSRLVIYEEEGHVGLRLLEAVCAANDAHADRLDSQLHDRL